MDKDSSLKIHGQSLRTILSMNSSFHKASNWQLFQRTFLSL